MQKIFLITASLIFPSKLLHANANPSSDYEDTSAKPIVGGNYSGYLPWFVSITGKNTFCGGSVISSFVILTAAHCFQNYTTVDDMHVLHGGTHIEHRKKTKIRTVIIHPKFWRESFYKTPHYDIAIVFIKEPMDFFVYWLWHHICPGSAVWAAGFGSTSLIDRYNPNATRPLSEYLKQTSLEVLEAHRCVRQKDMFLYEFCTHALGTSQCEGDSGGPIFGFDSNHNYVLYGIISSGYGCRNNAYPNPNMRISAHVHWIYNTILSKFSFSGLWRGS